MLRFPGFVYLSTHSYLPGIEDHLYGETSHFRCANDHLVGVRLPLNTDVDSSEVRDIAFHACGAWHAVEKYFEFDPPIGSVNLTLVPEGAKFDDGSLMLGRRMELNLALRHYRNRRDLFFQRYLVRKLGHELFHVYAEFGLGQNQDEELSAHLIESCVELSVIGSTSGDPTTVQGDRQMLLAASDGFRRDLTRSVQGGLLAREAIETLDMDLPVSRSDPDAGRLVAICKERSR